MIKIEDLVVGDILLIKKDNEIDINRITFGWAKAMSAQFGKPVTVTSINLRDGYFTIAEDARWKWSVKSVKSIVPTVCSKLKELV